MDPDHRIAARLFRNHCVNSGGILVKDLGLLGRSLDSVVMIDNSAVSYQFQPMNGIECVPFIDDMSDRELLEMIPFLEYLAKKPVAVGWGIQCRMCACMQRYGMKLGKNERTTCLVWTSSRCLFIAIYVVIYVCWRNSKELEGTRRLRCEGIWIEIQPLKSYSMVCQVICLYLLVRNYVFWWMYAAVWPASSAEALQIHRIHYPEGGQHGNDCHRPKSREFVAPFTAGRTRRNLGRHGQISPQ